MGVPLVLLLLPLAFSASPGAALSISLDPIAIRAPAAAPAADAPGSELQQHLQRGMAALDTILRGVQLQQELLRQQLLQLQEQERQRQVLQLQLQTLFRRLLGAGPAQAQTVAVGGTLEVSPARRGYHVTLQPMSSAYQQENEIREEKQAGQEQGLKETLHTVMAARGAVEQALDPSLRSGVVQMDPQQLEAQQAVLRAAADQQDFLEASPGYVNIYIAAEQKAQQEQRAQQEQQAQLGPQVQQGLQEPQVQHGQQEPQGQEPDLLSLPSSPSPEAKQSPGPRYW